MADFHLTISRAETGPAEGFIIIKSISQAGTTIYEGDEEDPIVVGDEEYKCDIEFYLETEGSSEHKHKAKLYQSEASFVIKPAKMKE